MSKQTLEQAIENAVVTERVVFASEAGYLHCCDAIARMKGPNNIFSMLKKQIYLQPVESTGEFTVEVTGSVTDVCIVVFAVATAYSSQKDGYTVEGTMQYLNSRYGFGFKTFAGETTTTLDLTQERIERIVGKERAVLLAPPVSESFCFTDNELHLQSAADIISNVMEVVQHLAIKVTRLPQTNTVAFEGDPLDVAAVCLICMEESGAYSEHKEAALKTLAGKYGLTCEEIRVCASRLKAIALARSISNGQRDKGSMTKQLLNCRHVEEDYNFFYVTDVSVVDEAFDMVSLIPNVKVIRTGERNLHLSGQMMNVLTLLITFSGMDNYTPVESTTFFEDLEKKYSVTREELILFAQKAFSQRPAYVRKQLTMAGRDKINAMTPGWYRHNTALDSAKLVLQDPSIYKDPKCLALREKAELVLRHFVQKEQEDEESYLEKIAEPHYEGLKQLFIQLRDKDVPFDDKQVLMGHLDQYVTLPMLIMVMEKHFQDTDM